MKRQDAAVDTVYVMEPLVQKLTELSDVVHQGQGIPVAVLVGMLMATLLEVGRRAMQSLLDLARISHHPSAASADLPAPAGRAPKIVLDKLQACLRAIFVRAPSIHGHFDALAANAGEKSGLVAAQNADACRLCCGQAQVSKGLQNRRFTCRFGQISYRRWRWLCLKCGRSELDKASDWELPSGRYSAEIREATERLSCRLGYGEAVDELAHLWGVAPDKSTAKRWVDRDGAMLEQVTRQNGEQHWAHYAQPQAAGVPANRRTRVREDGHGVVEADGVHVLTWKPGEEPRRKRPAAEAVSPPVEASEPVNEGASELTQNPTRHQPNSVLSGVTGSPMGPVGRSPRVRGREVCMGIAYLGEDAVEESPGRGALLNPRYVARLNERHHFWNQLHAAAAAKDVLRRKAVVMVTDGSEYLINHSKECFLGEPLVSIIDTQHVRQHVWEAGHALHSDKTELQQWVCARIELIQEGNVEAVLFDLHNQLPLAPMEAKRKAIGGLWTYLESHKTMMDYPQYHEKNDPLASAAIESANKRIVSRRCKQGGMLWSESGLTAMLALRVAFYNGNDWQSHWKHLGIAKKKMPDPGVCNAPSCRGCVTTAAVRRYWLRLMRLTKGA